MESKRGKRGTFLTDNLGWILIGILVLAIVVIGIIILTGKGSNALGYIQDLFRFGRG